MWWIWFIGTSHKTWFLFIAKHLHNLYLSLGGDCCNFNSACSQLVETLDALVAMDALLIQCEQMLCNFQGILQKIVFQSTGMLRKVSIHHQRLKDQVSLRKKTFCQFNQRCQWRKNGWMLFPEFCFLIQGYIQRCINQGFLMPDVSFLDQWSMIATWVLIDLPLSVRFLMFSFPPFLPCIRFWRKKDIFVFHYGSTLVRRWEVSTWNCSLIGFGHIDWQVHEFQLQYWSTSFISTLEPNVKNGDKTVWEPSHGSWNLV